jgi:hypothetical protein
MIVGHMQGWKVYFSMWHQSNRIVLYHIFGGEMIIEKEPKGNQIQPCFVNVICNKSYLHVIWKRGVVNIQDKVYKLMVTRVDQYYMVWFLTPTKSQFIKFKYRFKKRKTCNNVVLLPLIHDCNNLWTILGVLRS